MKQKMENQQKCEVVLKLGDNIVCQRFFSVRNFNNRACNSLDLHWTVSEILDGIVNGLKRKTLFLLEPNHIATSVEEAEGEVYFTLTITCFGFLTSRDLENQFVLIKMIQFGIFHVFGR